MITTDNIQAEIQEALKRVAPLWPLKRFVAVNPFLGLTGKPFEEACGILQRIHGELPTLQIKDYQSAWNDGRIDSADLEQACDEEWTPTQLVESLFSPELASEMSVTMATVADLLDGLHAHSHWGEFTVNEISRWCAVTLDENQTIWESPWKSHGLYAGWLEYARVDRNPEVFGLRGFRTFVQQLPEDATECVAYCLKLLRVTPATRIDYMHRLLATVAGWAGYVQYLVREDAMRGRSNSMLLELLAIRLAFDAALFRAFEDELTELPFRKDHVAGDRYIQTLAKWQYAYELGWQKRLARELAIEQVGKSSQRPNFQAVFCIDVRSEIFRRNLEKVSPDCQTIGFAGFFGIPLGYRMEGEAEAVARCPVLLVPSVQSTAHAVDEPRVSRELLRAWKGFQNSAVSCFSFVETIGLSYAAKLGLRGEASCGCSQEKQPVLAADTPRLALAAGILKNMGLQDGFGRLVLICGHGSQSPNNPYASALDCGACGGHAGDVNARLAAEILNDNTVRFGLRHKGILIPDDTVFLAGLHNTMTDEVVLFDSEFVGDSHAADLEDLRQALITAGRGVRAERAASLGYSGTDDLQRLIHERACDISQVRPEWALANNAAFVAAPRSRSAGLNLQGRVFLHDYDEAKDADHSVLTLILTAPVVVASWINLQYYASRVNPAHYSSGNKTLHNVAAGVGVFEGNGGDLRPGLPLQSIHNGEDWVHEPRRLSVFVEATPQAISHILESNPGVRELFTNQWIHLFALQGNKTLRYTRKGEWIPFV